MGGGISLVQEIDVGPPMPDPSSPTDAIRYCRSFIEHLIHFSNEFQQNQQLQQNHPGQPLSTMVDFDELTDKLKHVEASLMWLTASERRSSEKAQQDVQRHVQAERLKARLAKRKLKKEEEKNNLEYDQDGMMESIELETPRTAMLTPRIDSTDAQSKATLTQSTIKRTVNQVRAVIIDGVVWVTRLLEFGNQSSLSLQNEDALNAFKECNQLLSYLKESSVHNNVSDYITSPWDDFSTFTTACPLLLLLKSREIKRGVASYYDFQCLMSSINSMHADAFGAIGALMFGNMDHPDDSHLSSTASTASTAPPKLSTPVVHRQKLKQFINSSVSDFSGSQKIRVLDVGCGCGTLLDECTDEMRSAMDYVGVDISPETIAVATKRWCNANQRPQHTRFGSDEEEEDDDDDHTKTNLNRSVNKIQFICQDIIENSTFEEEEFDVIVCNDVLNYIPPSETLLILSKLKTWLCQDGDLFITIPIISVKDQQLKDSEKEAALMAADSNTATLNFMCGIERSHPFIPGLFFRMFQINEMQTMGTICGLQARRIEIIEPIVTDDDVVLPTPGPPVMTSSKQTSAWGQPPGAAINSNGSVEGDGGNGGDDVSWASTNDGDEDNSGGMKRGDGIRDGSVRDFSGNGNGRQQPPTLFDNQLFGGRKQTDDPTYRAIVLIMEKK